VVIGNPPYIRTGGISPPFKPKNETSKNEIQKYKKELNENIEIKYPFIKKVSGNCDYYIYFYLYGLSLLNPRGTFCFITSNSWLDVGYGRILQEFLVKYVPIKAIYDNQVKRSFAHASINTVIVFFGAPLIKNNKNPNPTCLDNVAKFIMLKKPCEEVISTQNLIAIDNFIPDTQSLFGNTLKTDQFRVYAIKQRNLLEEGIEIKQSKNEIFDNKLFGKYVGSKWGGKYLRAPEIFFTIIDKKKNNLLLELKDVAHVKAGILTGKNELYYKSKENNFDNNKYSLVFKSPREINKILITESDAVSIIKRKNVPFNIRKASLLWVDLRGDKHICHFNKDGLPFEHNFYGIEEKNGNNLKLCLLLNSTLTYLLVEVLGRKGLGGGAIRLVKEDLLKMPCLNIDKINNLEISKYQYLLNRKIYSVFQEFGFDSTKPLREQQPNPLPDRKALDDIVFDALGLTEEERKEVYWATAELVKNRLDKARSVKKK